MVENFIKTWYNLTINKQVGIVNHTYVKKETGNDNRF